MKQSKVFLILALSLGLLVSCNKAHYDLDNVQGVDVEGEMLLPLANGSFTLMDMMEKFEIDSLLTFDASGNMLYNFNYEQYGAVKGSELLKLNGLTYEEHLVSVNPYPLGLPYAMDTMVEFEHVLDFNSENIKVLEAVVRFGHFDFELESNIGVATSVVVRSPEIKDLQGNDLELEIPINGGPFGFSLDGMRYKTDVPNRMTFSYELHFTMSSTNDAELYLDFVATGSEMAIKEMTGYVDVFGTRNRIDTTFSLFPSQVAGVLNVNDISIRVHERNTFNMGARLVVDTAMFINPGLPPYPIYEPLPLTIDLPYQNNFNEVFNKRVSGQLDAAGSELYLSSNFIINPNGMTELVSVSDASVIDFRFDVDIPMAFRVSNVRYLDTVDMNMGEIDSPEWVKKLALELVIVSTIPLDLSGNFMMLDAETGQVTDALLDEGVRIAASYDGQPVRSSVVIEVTEERLQQVLQSDQLILDLQIDTQGHDVVLNANQGLQFFAKARAEYDGVVEFEN